MTFQFVHPAAEEFECLEDDGESTVFAYVGHDPDTTASYLVAATLSPFGDDFEYSFAIIERKDGNDRQFSSGLETKDLFEKMDRSAIRSVVLEATEILLNWKKPQTVDRCTSDANIPDSAMVKHGLVSHIFKNCGYSVTECGDWNGQLCWKAERVAQAAK